MFTSYHTNTCDVSEWDSIDLYKIVHEVFNNHSQSCGMIPFETYDIASRQK